MDLDLNIAIRRCRLHTQNTQLLSTLFTPIFVDFLRLLHCCEPFLSDSIAANDVDDNTTFTMTLKLRIIDYDLILLLLYCVFITRNLNIIETLHNTPLNTDINLGKLCENG